MIISRTPLRVSFAGGGTDIADYYRTGFGAVVSCTIGKYVYVTVNKRFDDDIRVSYSKTEIVDSVDKLEHGLVREALKLIGIRDGIEIATTADIPSMDAASPQDRPMRRSIYRPHLSIAP